MNDTPERTPLERRLAELEQRIARLEATHPAVPVSAPAPAPARVEAAAAVDRHAEDEFEFQVGQNWFATVGIGVLTLGAGFSLSLPYASLPAGLPSLVGAGVAVALFGLAQRWQQSFVLISAYLRGAAMALLYFATLRLYFFGSTHLLSPDTGPGGTLLVLVVAFNLVLAYRRRSPWLLGLALLLGYLTAIIVGTAGFLLPALVTLAGLAVAGGWRGGWTGPVLAGIILSPVTYFLWAAGNPLVSRSFHFVQEPPAGPGVLLATVLILGSGLLGRRPEQEEESGLANSGALLNCAFGYGVFLVHTLAAFPTRFAGAHLAAFLVLLALAVLFWARERSRISTFLYAMTGYLALSLAIIKLTAMPDVFVWLSLQSVVVVATAIWFRSRFIVVANFLIYVSIVLGYVLVAKSESGISIGFGVVALVSARILNWQKDRLELKTELMRNAYLFAAFVIFPYALYHLAPGRYVGLAWVGLALFYYALNLIVRNQKFRWMGHATLLLTTFYVAIVGTSRFGPVLRVLSLLALGTVMLAVSLIFTRMRQRSQPKKNG